MDQEAYNQLQALLRLFREHGLHELEVQEASFKLRLRRHRPRPAARARPRQPPPKAVPPKPRAGGNGRAVAVRSPLIGVFYRGVAPDAPPFVEIGDMVEEGQTVCIVEAMKVFNEIKAEWQGRVIAIPAENGALVQAGDPLVVLEFTEGHRRQEEG